MCDAVQVQYKVLQFLLILSGHADTHTQTHSGSVCDVVERITYTPRVCGAFFEQTSVSVAIAIAYLVHLLLLPCPTPSRIKLYTHCVTPHIHTYILYIHIYSFKVYIHIYRTHTFIEK